MPEPSFTVRKCSKAALRRFQQGAANSQRLAACLLFSDRPEQFVGGAWIKIGFFVSDGDLRYQDEVHGDLFLQIERTMELLQTKYLKAAISYRGLQRHETFPYPEAALREALLNAVVHKDYASGIPIQISVYDDHLVFWNPGVLPEHWTLKRLLGKHPSQPFNPLLANAFFRAGYIESWGRGVERIHDACKTHGIGKPEYDCELSGVMVTFRASALYVATVRSGGEAAGSAPDTTIPTPIATPITTPIAGDGPAAQAATSPQDRIVAALRATSGLRGPDLANLLGISAGGVKYHIRRLKAAGRIRRHGPKGGHWEVVQEASTTQPTTDATTTQELRPTTQETTQETRPTTQEPETTATTRARLLDLLRANASLTRQELARALDLTPDGVKYHMDQLKARGRLRRTGSTKKGRWEVLP